MRAFFKWRPIAFLFLAAFLSIPAFAETVSLPEAIEEAVKNNPGLKELKEGANVVRSGFWEAVLPENPEVFTEYEGMPDTGSLSGYEERKIGLVQELEFPLNYYLRGKRQKLREQANLSAYHEQVNEVVRDVKHSYYKVLLHTERIGLLTEVADLTRRLHHSAKVKADSGESTAYDELRARVDMARAKNELLAAEQEREYSLYELKQRLGRGRHETISVKGTMEGEPVVFSPDALKNLAMAHNPHLRHYLTVLEEKKKDREIAGMSLIPALNVSWFRLRIPGADDPEAWGGEVGLSLPVWGVLKERSRIKAAGHEVEAAGWRIEQEKRTILLAVDESYNRVTVARNRIVTFRTDMLKEVDELVRIAERSYQEGEMSYLQVIEALETLQQTKTEYTGLLYDYHAALADLETAVGIRLDDTTGEVSAR